MTLGSNSCAKHLGGVASIRLLPATQLESVEYDPRERRFLSLTPLKESEFVEVAFVENSASWEERVGSDGTVTHTLSFAIHGLQGDSVEQLRRLCCEGVVAVVETTEGEKFLLGYSPECGAEYPLRLSEALLSGGSRREQRAYTSLILSSSDGSLACHVEA